MTWQLAAECVEGLPPLSWLVVLPGRGGKIELLHGAAVELFPDGFFEGAWDGSFAEHGFAGSSNVFGSGGQVGADEVTFVGPSHTLEPLYFGRTDGLLAASNSLAFLLHCSGLKFDPRRDSYGAAFAESVEGLARTPTEIALPGGRLTILFHHNAALGTDGTIAVRPKPLPPSFSGYGEYVSYLREVATRVFRNAEDAARRYRYRPIATVSSGYDSAAVAVIAKDCGCTESMSLAASNRRKPDSGRATAETLGFVHSDYPGMPRGAGTTGSEAEFLASGMQGEDLYFSAFEKQLLGRIVTTGIHGGVLWGKGRVPSPDLKSLDRSGCSLGEFRLRCNFLHFPMAYIGAQRWPDIDRISDSPEMRPYSVGGGYDRPIARRLLEEAGLPRGSFARSKRAASILLFQGRNRMSRAARTSVAAYCRRSGLYARYLAAFYPKTLWWTIGRNLYRAFQQIGRRMPEGELRRGLARVRNGICKSCFGIEAPVFGASHPRFTILLTWALSEVEGRYAASGRGPAAQGRDAPALTRLSAAPIPRVAPAHRGGPAREGA